MWYFNKPYVSVAQRAANARKEAEKLSKAGSKLEPLAVEGRKFVREFWGKAWCKHIEAYCDAYNRLGRGRSYLTNGLVIDFKLRPGEVNAIVMGSSPYTVKVWITKLEPQAWKLLRSECSGRIGSLVDLLAGKLTGEVMSVITDPDRGLFPRDKQMKFSCTCPDAGGGGWMCKHIAATLYGIGARIDQKPDQLFLLRGVDHLDLIDTATAISTTAPAGATAPSLSEADLADVFGIDLVENGPSSTVTPSGRAPETSKPTDPPTATTAALAKKSAKRQAKPVKSTPRDKKAAAIPEATVQVPKSKRAKKPTPNPQTQPLTTPADFSKLTGKTRSGDTAAPVKLQISKPLIKDARFRATPRPAPVRSPTKPK